MYEVSDTPLPSRVDKDHSVNTYGKQLYQACKTFNFNIVNGRLSDGSGDFTFSDQMVLVLRILCVLHRPCIHYSKNFKIESRTALDHLPPVIALPLNHGIPDNRNAEYVDSSVYMDREKYTWQDRHINNYNENVILDFIIRQLDNLTDVVKVDVDTAVQNIIDKCNYGGNAETNIISFVYIRTSLMINVFTQREKNIIPSLLSETCQQRTF